MGRAPRVPAGTLRSGGTRGDPQGRLRAVRWRLAHVHRDVIRPAGDPRHRGARVARLPARGAGRISPADPPDADDRPAGRAPGARAGGLSAARPAVDIVVPFACSADALRTLV